jgi:hypothetical protein
LMVRATISAVIWFLIIGFAQPVRIAPERR